MAEYDLMRIDASEQIRNIAGSSHLASSMLETKSEKAKTTDDRGPCHHCNKKHHPSYCPDLPCDVCNKEYHHRAYCPDLPCDICYKKHRPAMCPYFTCIPQGAIVSPRYHILCDCGNMFDQDRWVCTCCYGKHAKIVPKYCLICDISYQHATHECPEDKIVAAEYKLARDKSLELARSTVEQIYVPKVSYDFTPLGFSGSSGSTA